MTSFICEMNRQERKVVSELEHLLGKKLELIDDFSEICDHQGFSVENKQVIKMGLYNCGLKILPDSIGKLTSLKYLDLERNNLTSLPESIGNLKNLETLRLTDNRLKSIPESIGNLTSLRKLILKSNQLTSLPESIGKLEKLMLLVLTDNNINHMPESAFKLPSLKFIDFD